MDFGDRLKESLLAAQVSQADLARRIGISQPSVSYLVKHGANGSKHLRAIARELKVSEAYLEGRTDNPVSDARLMPNQQEMAEHLDLVPIAEIDQDYGMGGSFIDDHVEVAVHHFPRVWVESITLSPPSCLTIARGKGDSMDPTIRDRDMVIIDRSRRTMDETDAIWALTVGNIGMIKRLRMRGSTVVIQSDNDRVKDEEVHADEVHLVGRVVFIGRRT